MSDLVLEQVKQLAASLSTLEKVQLVEWLGATLEQDLAQSAAPLETFSWGQQAVALLTESDVGLNELTDIPDAAEWVHRLRRQPRSEGDE